MDPNTTKFDDLKELCGLVVAAKVLLDGLLIDLVRAGRMTLEEAGNVIWSSHQAVESRKGSPQNDDEVLAHAMRALESSSANLIANAGPQTLGRA
jgi:hypothetical protein